MPESLQMFAPPIAKPKEKSAASSNNKAALQGRTKQPESGSAWERLSLTPLSPPSRTGDSKPPSSTSAPRKPIQKMLNVGAVSDPLEHEADRVADQVMRMPTPDVALSFTPPQANRKCAECEEEEKLQKKEAGTPEAATSEAPASVHEVLRSPGEPLDDTTRAYFEPRFGKDFSGVRVHTDAAAEQSARDVNAHAYTVGHNVVFNAGRFASGTHDGQRLIAHELTHVMQQSVGFGTLQRTPAAPVTAGSTKVPFDRSKLDIGAIRDVRLDTDLQQLMAIARPAFVQFIDPAITSYSTTLYDPVDSVLSTSANSPVPGGLSAAFPLFANSITGLAQGRYILRCIGYDTTSKPVAYADRSFYVWTSTPTGKPPDIAALEAEKTALEAITKVGSGKSFDEVAIAFTKLRDVTQRLGILTTGTGPFVGSVCPVKPAGAVPLNCTNIVLFVLENVFTQQGRGADWAKVKKKQAEHTKSHKTTGLEGEDIQAALQSEAGWKGIFWAPDPKYEIPQPELKGARSDEAGYAFERAKKKGVYKEPGKPGVSIEHLVTNYAPEAPLAGHGAASLTRKDTTQLDKLKKLPFGVLSAHEGFHMTLIIYGKVIEVHWSKEATDVNLIEQTDLEKWAVGPVSGYHYYASGVIVAPAADVDAAFK